MKIKQIIFDYLTPEESDPLPEKIFNYSYSVLILLNVLAVILETDSNLYTKYSGIFYNFEIISVCIFTIEYILRVYTANLIPSYKAPFLGRIKYILSFMAIIDLLSFLPFYFPLMWAVDLRFLRIFRLIRFLRLFKIGRYSNSLRIFKRVFLSRKSELLSGFILVLFLITLSSCLIYFAENEAQPDKYSSIPECFYWSVVTLTSVGYGDIYPITPLGKFFTIIIALLGLSLVVLPTSILASAYSDELKNNKCIECPKCKHKFKE